MRLELELLVLEILVVEGVRLAKVLVLAVWQELNHSILLDTKINQRVSPGDALDQDIVPSGHSEVFICSLDLERDDAFVTLSTPQLILFFVYAYRIKAHIDFNLSSCNGSFKDE